MTSSQGNLCFDVCGKRRDEFTNFMFLEKAQAAAGEGDSDNWRLFPADFRDENSATSMHHEQVRCTAQAVRA
jgi:hypothetical protein